MTNRRPRRGAFARAFAEASARTLAVAGAIALMLATCFPSFAASYSDASGTVWPGAVMMSNCNAAGICQPVSAASPLQVAGSFSATLSGFSPASIGTPISATVSGVTGTLPAGTTNIVIDTGTFPAYCQAGSSAVGITNSKLIAAGGGQWAISGITGSITCEGVGGTTTINMLGGSGLAVDSGGGGGGGSGGAVTQSGAWTVGLSGTLPAFAATPTFNIGTAPTIAVTGTFFQGTQPISAASLPLPSGAATQTTSAAIQTALGSPFQAGGSIGNTAFGISGTLPAFAATPTFNIGTAPTIAVTGTFWQATQPISASALPLPSGASTAALQPAINADLGAQSHIMNFPIGNGTSQAASLAVTSTDPIVTGTGASGANIARVTVSNDSVPSLALVSTASMTRIANTTTYTANTGWNTLASSATAVFTFNNACRTNAGLVAITGMDVWSSANPTAKLTGILWLFSASPATVVNDDATFNIASADFANLTGGAQSGLPFTLQAPQGTGATNSGVTVNLGVTNQAQCATGATTLYGMVQVVSAYVPASGEVLHVALHTYALN